MNKLIAALMLVSAPLYARDLSPSLGLSYNKMSLSGGTNASSVLSRFDTQSITVDLLFPINQSFSLTLSGGSSSLDLGDQTPTYALIPGTPTATIAQEQASGNKHSLSGYNLSIGARWYFWKR